MSFQPHQPVRDEASNESLAIEQTLNNSNAGILRFPIARKLPNQTKMAGAQRLRTVQQVARTYGNRIVQRWLASSSGTVIQRWADSASAEQVIAALRTANQEQLRALLAALDSPNIVNDQIAITLPDRSTSIAVADATEIRQRVSTRLVEMLVEDLATTRTPAEAQMRGADTDEARRTAMVALRAIDEPRLTELRRITNNNTNLWRHSNASYSDAVLAALQLEAVFRAERYLENPANAREESARAVGMSSDLEWCGFFVANNYMASSLDRDLRAGFFATGNVRDYFSYRYGSGSDARVKRWIFADNAWSQLDQYHDSRGSRRMWTDARDIRDIAVLDIRPGDVVLVDHSDGEMADHIQMVHSYNPTTRELFYIDGNGGGYVVENNPRRAGAATPRRDRVSAATGHTLGQPTRGGHVGVGSHDLNSQPDPDRVHANPERNRPSARVYGIGRPSIVDFENHYYDNTSQRNPPTIPPSPNPRHAR
jgi:hypothetical protein